MELAQEFMIFNRLHALKLLLRDHKGQDRTISCCIQVAID